MIINKYIGIPYESRGRSWEATDCYGLVQLFYKEEFGIDVPDYLWAYTTAEDKESVSAAIEQNKTNWQQIDDPEYGDVLVFQIAGYPMHVGIKMRGDDFLHCFQNTQSCLERLSSLSWSRRLVESYRWAS
jgi:cell wall-associated NlpC family hydrolase